MYKLSLSLFLLLWFSYNAQSQIQQHKFILVNNKDTSTTTIKKHKDTVFFEIAVKKYNHKLLTYEYALIEQLKNKKKPFVFINKDINDKYYQIRLKDSVYFTKKYSGRQTQYSRMIDERTAFILNRVIRYKCLTVYNLQKNGENGKIKLAYSPDFGLLNLYLNNMGEETDIASAISVNFKLISVDGQKPKDYLKNFCQIK